MRPPSVSLFFFAGALAFVIFGAYSTREDSNPAYKKDENIQPLQTVTVADNHQAPDFTWRFNALDPGLIEASAAPSLFDPTDAYWGLPRTDGADLVAGYCAACHSLRIVMQQSASEARWRELMVWMIDKQGMAPPPDDDLELIVKYLSEHFGS